MQNRRMRLYEEAQERQKILERRRKNSRAAHRLPPQFRGLRRERRSPPDDQAEAQRIANFLDDHCTPVSPGVPPLLLQPYICLHPGQPELGDPAINRRAVQKQDQFLLSTTSTARGGVASPERMDTSSNSDRRGPRRTSYQRTPEGSGRPSRAIATRHQRNNQWSRWIRR